jgi:hypothetical protein
MLTSIFDTPAWAYTLKVSGTLKHLKTYLKRLSPNDLLGWNDTEPKDLKKEKK